MVEVCLKLYLKGNVEGWKATFWSLIWHNNFPKSDNRVLMNELNEWKSTDDWK